MDRKDGLVHSGLISFDDEDKEETDEFEVTASSLNFCLLICVCVFIRLRGRERGRLRLYTLLFELLKRLHEIDYETSSGAAIDDAMIV